ncbi:MAG: hypothetical protein LR011_08220, partial [Verrucomicrobia bacterium]|nr:hypothetical protein [Verrucomicrobiota bacterium]
KPVTIEGPQLGLPDIPNGYVITTTPIPNAQNLDSAIRTFYGTDNPAPGAAIASQLKSPGGSPQDSIQLNFETSVPTVLTSILSVATPSAHTIFKSGIEVEIFVPVTFSGMDQIGTVDGPLQMVFQPLMGPSPGQLDPEANDPLILVETPASPPIPGLRKFTARSHFDSILSSDSNGKAWVSLQWTISQSMPDGIQLGAIRLITQDLQKRARILSISRAAETIELEIDAAAGARLFIESSPDSRNWADFTSLNPTQPTTTVILPADGLPDTIFFRAHQGVNR